MNWEDWIKTQGEKLTIRNYEDMTLSHASFDAGYKLAIEKAAKWFRNQKEEIGISWFDDFEIRFRKEMNK